MTMKQTTHKWVDKVSTVQSIPLCSIKSIDSKNDIIESMMSQSRIDTISAIYKELQTPVFSVCDSDNKLLEQNYLANIPHVGHLFSMYSTIQKEDVRLTKTKHLLQQQKTLLPTKS